MSFWDIHQVVSLESETFLITYGRFLECVNMHDKHSEIEIISEMYSHKTSPFFLIILYQVW